MNNLLPKNNKKIIVCFAGSGMKALKVPQPEFLKTLNRLFPYDEKRFFIDKEKVFYHKGITDISNDIPTTIEYLQNLIKDFSETVFMGSSAGGYAAILFGSLISVQKIIAFIPQTNIQGYSEQTIPEYENLKPLINNVTEYHLFGCLKEKYNSVHGKIHLDNLMINKNNIKINLFDQLNLKKLRDSGELDSILKNIIDPYQNG